MTIATTTAAGARRSVLLGAAVALLLMATSGCKSASAEKIQPPPAKPVGSGSVAPAPLGPPLPAKTLTLALRPLEVSVPTVGTLLANEAVQVVSELSRRLVKVHVKEGADVKKGALLFTLDSADLHADLRKLRVQRGLAQTQEKRLRVLREEGLATQQEYDTASAAVDEVNASIAALGVSLGRTQIRAPFAGRVGLRRVSEGAWVTPSVPLVTLQDISQLKLDFTLPDRFGTALRPGQRFSFRVAGQDRRFEGQVVAVEPQIDASSRSVQVRGLCDNQQGLLLPGAFASVELPLGDIKQALMVPAEAVVPTPSGRSVFLLKGGVARSVDVEVGLRSVDDIELLSGVAVGDVVLVSNLLRLRDGARVVPQP